MSAKNVSQTGSRLSEISEIACPWSKGRIVIISSEFVENLLSQLKVLKIGFAEIKA